MSNVLGSNLFWASTLVPEYGARALVAMHGSSSIARILSDPTPYDQHDQYGDLREHDGAAGLKPPDLRGGESCQDRYKPHGGARNTCLPPTTGDDKCTGDRYRHHRAYDQGAYGARCDGDGECAGVPKRRASPCWGTNSPSTNLRSVDLPAPFSPERITA